MVGVARAVDRPPEATVLDAATAAAVVLGAGASVVGVTGGQGPEAAEAG